MSMTIWLLIGAALVFFMQAGFAMVEAGFTRAKNAGNIIMKNLMDFCIGTVVFMLLGFGILLGEDALGGFIGKPTLDIFTNWKEFDWANFVFNLVFCATTATIVSGAMAERTKFSTYCIYSAIISAVIYPIEAHWVWGGGWLAQRGYVDFAGSSAIHMVGGIAALIGAAMLGPRIGKYDKNGKPKAILGHSIPLGALGVFILWFGWYGFNGAAAASPEFIAQIFVTTTIAPAVAACVTMAITWIKMGKPDVSMTLNAALAGLVGITAGCSDLDAIGATAVGVVSGILVVFAVWLLDYKLKVDDPVGAVPVHMFNGIWGTLAVGLFATGEGQNGITGLFYGGGFKQLGIQSIGVLAIGVWTAVTLFITFFILKKTIGLRVSKQEEIIGLDREEHGLISSYAGFMMSPESVIVQGVDGGTYPDTAVSVEKAIFVETFKVPANTQHKGPKLTKIVAIFNQSKFEAFKEAMNKIGVTGMTVTNVLGCGMQNGSREYYRGVPVEINILPKVKVEIAVCKVPVSTVVQTAKNVLYTGQIGDGKLFIYDIENVIKIRTGEEGYDALQDE